MDADPPTSSIVDVPPRLCKGDTPGVVVVREEQALVAVVVVRTLTVRVLVTPVPEGCPGCEAVCSVPQISSARFQVAEILSEGKKQ